MERFWDGQIIDSMICAGIGEQDAAGGDSGGPLLQLDSPNGDYTLGEPSYDLLVGITSFGVDSRYTFKPGVYTRIAYFKDWIDYVIEEKENCSSGSQGTMENATDVEALSSAPGIIMSDEGDSHDLRSAEPSFVSPELLLEPSFVSPESLPERSEEDAQSVEELLDFRLDVKPQRIVNQTLALESAREAIVEDDSETVGELLCAGLSPNTRFSVSKSNTSWTLLHEAARYNAIKSTRILVDSGADVDKKNTLEYTPLHYAARFGSLQVVEVLVDNAANVNARSNIGRTPLHYASAYNQFDVVKFLIKNGASKKKQDDYGNTPFDEICVYSSCSPKQISRLRRILRN